MSRHLPERRLATHTHTPTHTHTHTKSILARHYHEAQATIEHNAPAIEDYGHGLELDVEIEREERGVRRKIGIHAHSFKTRSKKICMVELIMHCVVKPQTLSTHGKNSKRRST